MLTPPGPAIPGLDPTATWVHSNKDECGKIFTAPLLGLAADGNSLNAISWHWLMAARPHKEY